MVEAVDHAGGHEEKIACRKERSLIAARELAVAADDDEYLVPSTGGAVVAATRGAELDLETSMTKRDHEAFAFGAGKFPEPRRRSQMNGARRWRGHYCP